MPTASQIRTEAISRLIVLAGSLDSADPAVVEARATDCVPILLRRALRRIPRDDLATLQELETVAKLAGSRETFMIDTVAAGGFDRADDLAASDDDWDTEVAAVLAGLGGGA